MDGQHRRGGGAAMWAGRNSPRGKPKSFEATDAVGIGLSFPSPLSGGLVGAPVLDIEA